MLGPIGESKMDHLARTPKQIGSAVRRYRRLQGLTQKDLGARTNLRQATISELENGKPGTQLRTLVDVLAALGLEVTIRERGRSEASIEDIF